MRRRREQSSSLSTSNYSFSISETYKFYSFWDLWSWESVSNSSDDWRDCFKKLVHGIGSATQLEDFHFDVGVIMRNELYFQWKGLFEAFARNLTACKNLKRLKIFNEAHYQSGRSYYSLGFLLALIPALKCRVSSIVEMTLVIGDSAIAMPLSSSNGDRVHDFFIAILSLRRLKDFRLQLSPLLNIFLESAGHVQ